MDLKKYINRSKSNDKEIWLHNLPNDETLFDVIDNLRKQYNNLRYTFVINQEIRITGITIDRDVDFSNCIFKNEEEIENSGNIQIEPSVIFNNVKFKGIVDFSNTFLYGVKFENVDFIGEGKNIYFQNSSLYDIKFKNVNFNFSTYFYNSEIEKLSFEDTTFRGNTNFRQISFNGETKFLNCTFTSLQNDASEEVSFSESIFKQEANFSGSIFDVKANFSDTKFGIKQEDNLNENNSEVKFLFENAKFQKEINFSKAIFYDTIYFSGTEFCIDIKEYVEKSINFENAQFRRKVRFHHCKFHNTVRFENTLFNKLADFYSAHFHKAQQFHFTDFLDRAIFSNTEFDQEVQFLHCKVTKDSYVRFESAIFNKGLDISRSNFNDKVNFWNIEIKEGDIFTSSKYADDFEVHKNEINPEKNIPSVYKQLRETYRIIKDNFYKQNNKVEGLRFYEKEMSVYLEEKRAEDKKSSSTNNFTLRNLSLENKVDKSFANSPFVKKKLTFFTNFFLCFYQVVFLPFYELLPIVEILENILFQFKFKKTFKNLFSFLHSIFYKLNLFSFLYNVVFPFLYNVVFPFLYKAFYKLFFFLYNA